MVQLPYYFTKFYRVTANTDDLEGLNSIISKRSSLTESDFTELTAVRFVGT